VSEKKDEKTESKTETINDDRIERDVNQLTTAWEKHLEAELTESVETFDSVEKEEIKDLIDSMEDEEDNEGAIVVDSNSVTQALARMNGQADDGDNMNWGAAIPQPSPILETPNGDAEYVPELGGWVQFSENGEMLPPKKNEKS
jgi:hypothetical protein